MESVRRWMLNFGLWPRVAIAISLSFITLSVAYGVLGERAVRDGADRVLNERLVIAQMAASQIDDLLERAVSELQRARRFADFDPADPDLLAEADVLSHTYGRVGIFTSGVVFLDPRGYVILSHPSGLYPLGANLSGLPHITQAMARREMTVSDPFRDSVTDRAVVAVTVPIFEKGHFRGLLSGLVDLDGQMVMAPLEQTAALGHTGHAVLVDGQGRALASTLDLPFLSPGEHSHFYRRAVAGGVPIVDTVPFELNLPGEEEGHAHVMAFAPLRLAPWGVAVGGDVDETFAGVSRLRLGLALLSVVALVSIWAATLIGTRRLVRPVQLLTEAAQRIAGGDLHTPLEASEGGEIGAMAVALERMRLLLLSNIEELARWNETLEARVAKRTKALHRQQALTQQLLHRVITAQEEERARLSQELHDEIGQTLTAVQLSLERLARSLPAGEIQARERLERAEVLTEEAIVDLRRVIAALRPGVLDQLGLEPALGWIADHTLRPLGLNVTIDVENLRARLPGEIETILFRIAQEAMSNVARHSQARNLDVHLKYAGGQVAMTLADDGQGFDLSAVDSAPELGRGLGLAGMQERASLVGGQVTVQSTPGRGTTVHVIVPALVPAATGESTRGGNPMKALLVS
ncbi:MAG: histidine kinase [Anaerolineae bacterium]